MAVRENFQLQLKELKQMLLELGNRAETALKDSIFALKEQNVDKALEIIENDHRINELEDEINDLALVLIAKQSPVASDLRKIIAAIKISSDVERMADYGVNIAKCTIRIGEKKLIKPLEEIPKMAELSIQMLSMAIAAYVEEDVVMAKQLADIDDQVDEMYGRLIQELLEMMTQNPDYIAQITQLAFVCRYLERAADHATNIAESVIFLVKGKRYGLND